MPTFQFDDIMTDDAKLLNFLEGLRDFGFTVLKGAPAETGPIVKLGERISYLKLTVYGNVVSLKSKIDPHNLGFTGHKLGLHTDLPHYHYPPNITVFHCIKQSAAGGESVFADGFKTALQLREENPEAFQILCDTNCDFINRGQDMIEYYTKCSRPTFRLDKDGNISEVYFCNVARDTRLRMPVEKVYPYYKAIKSYVELMYRPENTVNFRLQPGDMVVFENTRILHGRNSFEATEDAERHLEIAFLDWDGVYSKIRCLRERLAMSFHEY
ncbi:gamma-butyrobetaine dioxygenase-like [Ptychodera flava]|uniref:gamma-butyrobetaine dioxygenase-like n=1 Tax=Ptychodera flava TaxID=63121 RepID=UPI003969EC33